MINGARTPRFLWSVRTRIINLAAATRRGADAGIARGPPGVGQGRVVPAALAD